MDFPSPHELLTNGRRLVAKGPVALIFVEDAIEIASTLRHHAALGFREVIAFAPAAIPAPDEVSGLAHWVTCDTHAPGAVRATVNAVIAAAPAGTWFYYGYNAEYLFFPFSETRTVGELLAFHAEERRDAMLASVIDLYAPDLGRHPDAVSLAEAMFDRSGYSALPRHDPETGAVLERQHDLFGGLRWRFEEHVPWERRRIDRVALFRAAPGLALREDHTFSTEEYNTGECPWHRNLTAAVLSFRAAKALKSNPGSTYDIRSFLWQHSTPFEWRAQQLLDLGIIEPGQWF
ncbi:MAG: hypothetical protein KDE00_01300 [Rhodobacteraceae bacterium]|nr:hypothetical protein [Paracoccaceae bacterium]